MEFYYRLKFEFTEFYTEHIHLSEEEWKMMIMVFCLELAEKPVGSLLFNKLTEFIDNKYNIKISNYDTELRSSYIYPKIRFQDPRSVLIIIPSVPYFVKVEVLTESLEFFPDNYNLNQVLQYKPARNKLESSSNYKDNKNQVDCINLEKLPPIIGFAHELVHCLRHFERLDTNNSNEEEHTIYGIGSNTLSYDIAGRKVYITENTIRKDFGFRPRMSHSSSELYCWRLPSTYSNSGNFTKEDFFK
jgi:hypothetical protein